MEMVAAFSAWIFTFALSWNWVLIGRLLGSFLVGCIGSGAYFTALYFKFVGRSDAQRKIILDPFIRYENDEPKVSIRKVVWYCCLGGSIAVVFQYSVPNFVAIQSFIIGATWPSVVSQFLSGRMEEPTKDEREAQLDTLKLKRKSRQSQEDVLDNLVDNLVIFKSQKKKS